MMQPYWSLFRYEVYLTEGPGFYMSDCVPCACVCYTYAFGSNALGFEFVLI